MKYMQLCQALVITCSLLYISIEKKNLLILVRQYLVKWTQKSNMYKLINRIDNESKKNLWFYILCEYIFFSISLMVVKSLLNYLDK